MALKTVSFNWYASAFGNIPGAGVWTPTGSITWVSNISESGQGAWQFVVTTSVGGPSTVSASDEIYNTFTLKDLDIPGGSTVTAVKASSSMRIYKWYSNLGRSTAGPFGIYETDIVTPIGLAVDYQEPSSPTGWYTQSNLTSDSVVNLNTTDQIGIRFDLSGIAFRSSPPFVVQGFALCILDSAELVLQYTPPMGHIQLGGR